MRSDLSVNRICLLAVLMGVALAGCTPREDRSLAFPVDLPLDVMRITGNGQPTHYLLQPSSENYRKIQDWLAINQVGWSDYLATSPGRGIFVSAGELRLQFVETTVLACKQGCLYKSVSPSDYAFLVQP
jgi:hypothetical protein